MPVSVIKRWFATFWAELLEDAPMDDLGRTSIGFLIVSAFSLFGSIRTSGFRGNFRRDCDRVRVRDCPVAENKFELSLGTAREDPKRRPETRGGDLVLDGESLLSERLGSILGCRPNLTS